MPETCRVFLKKIKFGKFVSLVGFIKKKFVTIHGHVNLKCQTRCTSQIHRPIFSYFTTLFQIYVSWAYRRQVGYIYG